MGSVVTAEVAGALPHNKVSGKMQVTGKKKVKYEFHSPKKQQQHEQVTEEMKRTFRKS